MEPGSQPHSRPTSAGIDIDGDDGHPPDPEPAAPSRRALDNAETDVFQPRPPGGPSDPEHPGHAERRGKAPLLLTCHDR